MIDSHCHLYELGEIEGEVQRFREAGGTAMVGAGADLETSKKSVEAAQTYPEIFATVGIHPEGKTKSEILNSKQFFKSQLLDLAKHKKVVAVGECGLDNDSEEEAELFKFNIKLARETGLPLVVHCRNMFKKVFEVLDLDNVQIHCFTGNEEETRECARRGWYISFGGILTFKKSDELRRVAKLVPEDRLLVETDSPYLAPEPVRGTRNSPVNVKYVIACLAEVRSRSFQSMVETTARNAKRLFKI